MSVARAGERNYSGAGQLYADGCVSSSVNRSDGFVAAVQALQHTRPELTTARPGASVASPLAAAHEVPDRFHHAA